MLSDNTWALGRIDYMKLSQEDSDIISKHYGVSITAISIFKRLQRNGETFYCQQYTKVKRRNSYSITYCPGELYGQIVYFILLNGKPAAVIKKLSVLSVPEAFSPAQSIVPVKVLAEKDVISVDAISQKVVFVNISDTVSYVVKFPCTLNID